MKMGGCCVACHLCFEWLNDNFIYNIIKTGRIMHELFERMKVESATFGDNGY